MKIPSTERIDLDGLNFKHFGVILLKNVQVKIKGSTCFGFCATSVQNFENGGEIVRGNEVHLKNIQRFFLNRAGL